MAISLLVKLGVKPLLFMMLLSRLFCLAAAAELITAWDWNNESQPIAIYRSRPDLLAPIMTVLEGIHDKDRMAPGYFFVSPYTNMQQAIYIFDNNADLVYSSFGSYGGGASHAPQICTYHGEIHLCFYQGVQHVGWAHGHGVIMDQNYRIVKSIEPSCTYQASSDMHEFYLTDDGTRAIMSQFVRSVYDLCPWGLCDGLGYLQSGAFQEVEVETGQCIFGWKSNDWIPPEDSLVPPASTEISGDGESPETPWDYFHINSIDKSSFDGNYLISARHMSAVYKISATTGEILWQLGGKRNQYEYDNELGQVEFGFQHDVRWISDSEEESVISMFDNASNGYAQTFPHSIGKFIRINHKTKVARLVERTLDGPWVDGHTHISKSQGNFQLNLPSHKAADIGGQQVAGEVGNRLMGFGNDPFMAEYALNENGDWEAVFYSNIAYGYSMNYRAMKFDGWQGVPLTKPALWAYSQMGMNNSAANNNKMVLYASWNGHTKIDNFLFRGANSEGARRNIDSLEWETLTVGFKKQGFETIYTHLRTFKYVYVEVFDSKSVSLGKSEIMETFVPNAFMRKKYCDELACHFMDTNNPERERMREDMKEAYDAWSVAKEESDDDTEQDPDDFYEDVSSLRGGKAGVGKVVGFSISFGVLAVFLIAVAWVALRRYTTWQKGTENLLVGLGLKKRRFDEFGRGKYAGLSSGEGSVEDGDLEDEMQQGTALRSNDNSLSESRKEGGLEAERQGYWRAQSP